jgi:hypothetical protein
MMLKIFLFMLAWHKRRIGVGSDWLRQNGQARLHCSLAQPGDELLRLSEFPMQSHLRVLYVGN